MKKDVGSMKVGFILTVVCLAVCCFGTVSGIKSNDTDINIPFDDKFVSLDDSAISLLDDQAEVDFNTTLTEYQPKSVTEAMRYYITGGPEHFVAGVDAIGDDGDIWLKHTGDFVIYHVLMPSSRPLQSVSISISNPTSPRDPRTGLGTAYNSYACYVYEGDDIPQVAHCASGWPFGSFRSDWAEIGGGLFNNIYPQTLRITVPEEVSGELGERSEYYLGIYVAPGGAPPARIHWIHAA